MEVSRAPSVSLVPTKNFFKNNNTIKHQRLTPVTLATEEAEIRRTAV
jgi:hypothetical protein